MPYGLLIGAGVGLLKNELVDVPREAKQRALAAATQKYAPWTGLQAQPIQLADPFANALQFGTAGAGMVSGWGTASALQNYLNSNKSNINTTPGPTVAGGPGDNSGGSTPSPGATVPDDNQTQSFANEDDAMKSVQDNYKAGDLAGTPGSTDSQDWVDQYGNSVPVNNFGSPVTSPDAQAYAFYPDANTVQGQPGFFGMGPRSQAGSSAWLGMGS